MSINALNFQPPVQHNEGPPAAAAAPGPATTALVVEHENILGEIAKVKLSEAEKVELNNKLWQLRAGVHNGMEVWQLNEIGAQVDAINHRLAEDAKNFPPT